MLVTYLDADTPPERMPSPFAIEPHPLARRAAAQLRAELDAGLARDLALAEDGKMFGVLVVADGAGRIGFLRAFSGMVRGRWHLDGFAPPTFDVEARDAFWPAGECELARLGADIHELEVEIAPLRTQLDALVAQQQIELNDLRARHRANRDTRRLARAALSRCTCSSPASDRPPDSVPFVSLWFDPPASVFPEGSNHTDTEIPEVGLVGQEGACPCAATRAQQRDALDQQSRADTAERRRLDARHAAERAELERQVRSLDSERETIDAERAAKSRDFLQRIHATYALPNARGELRALADIFAPAAPPGGAGDCAAPKLLAYAYRNGLRPLALAEIWCGAPSLAGGRRDGSFYPACRGKCGPILSHMLAGLDVEPAPEFGTAPTPPHEPITLFEDRYLAIVVKPAGLLSVPGRGTANDCVQTRLRARYPTATGPLVVHRLDLDTSGVMLVAKDLATYAALQRQFTERSIDKRYIAWLDGEVAGDHGRIDLPMRVDLDDRPRQIVDFVHGRPAVTEWRVAQRRDGRTRVVLGPKTGRAHQLRLHAAHPRGLAVPIVGDRLYGRPDGRLLLHAEAIAFVHPHTHERIERRSVAPF